MVLNTDEDYVKEISRGNKAAFDQLFKKYYLALRNYAYKIVKDKSLAEDIVQDTFFNLWLKHDQFKDVNNVGAYIRTSIHNESISVLRKKVHNEIVIENSTINEFEKLYSDILQYQDTSLNKELSLKIAQAIDLLPQQCRTIFILSRSFGFKHKEIASQLDISVKAVEKQITKALSHLREHLKEYLTAIFMYFFLE